MLQLASCDEGDKSVPCSLSRADIASIVAAFNTGGMQQVLERSLDDQNRIDGRDGSQLMHLTHALVSLRDC